MWCADLLRRARGVFSFFESGVRHRREVEATTTGRRDNATTRKYHKTHRPQSSIAGRLEDPTSSTAWYDHQQHRLLQSGVRFERAAKWRWFRRPEEGARATTALRRFDADGSGVVSRGERDLALAGWQADYDATARAFERSTGTRYRHQPGTLPTDPERLRSWATWWVDLQARVHITPPQEQTAERTAKAAKLADAVASQASFVGRVLALGPRIITDEWIDRAITRYGQFLDLARRDPGATLVPTLDIDLIWHVHMLSPRNYLCENQPVR